MSSPIRNRSVLAFTLVALAVALSACGTDEEKTTAINETSKQITDLEKQIADDEKQIAAANTCQKQLAGLLRSLSDLDSRLQVGLSYDDHTSQVQEISIAYNRIDINALDLDCTLGSGVAAEKAFNEYQKADNSWNSCIVDFDCETESIDPELQEHWSKASDLISKAQRSLDKMASEPEKDLADQQALLDEAQSKLAELEGS